MIEQGLHSWLTSLKNERLRLESDEPIRRIEKVGPIPEGALVALSENPRLDDVQPSVEDITWPLHVLLLPKIDRFKDVEDRVGFILDQIDASASKAQHGDEDLGVSQAYDRVMQAYLFLRWPQNRERVSAALEITPDLAPKEQALASTSHPSRAEKRVGFLHSAVVRAKKLVGLQSGKE
jgi:hypothetical protein